MTERKAPTEADDRPYDIKHSPGGIEMLRELSVFGGSAILLLAIGWTTPGFARVECQGDFQVTKYGLIATPYCEEENIAIVAQSYGWQVTGSQVRKNPLKKVYICQVLGRDIRLKGSCAGYSPDAYAPGR